MVTNRKNLIISLGLLLIILTPQISVGGMASVLNHRIVSKEIGRYLGWPSVAKLQCGRIMVVYSGDRDWHVCPWGKINMVYSDDGGASWSEPETIANTPLDDRDPGLLVTNDGTIMVTWNNSMAFADTTSDFYTDRYSQYNEHAAAITNEIRQQWLGSWLTRSIDGGITWSEPVAIPFHTPHGPIQLRDGRILMVAGPGVAESLDYGESWRIVSRFRSGFGRLSELYSIEREDGEIVVLSRAPNLNQFGSSDGGITWSVPFQTPINGYPPHILELDNQWLVVVYAKRTNGVMGQYASISKDGGQTWDVENEIKLIGANAHTGTEEDLGYPLGWDLGYPASVVLDDGTLFTVYYQVDEDGELPSILGTHWKIDTPTNNVFRHFYPSISVPTNEYTHLNVNFNEYDTGPVNSQSKGASGVWSGASEWHGNVIDLELDNYGYRALEVYSSSQGTSGRGFVPICPGTPEMPNLSLKLESPGKAYWAVDLYAKSLLGGLALIMADTSPGKVSETGFRINFSAGQPISHACMVTAGAGDGAIQTVDSSFVPNSETWYRVEMEITQGNIPGKGYFSVYISQKGSNLRRAILINKPYSFTATQFSTLHVVPLGYGSVDDAIRVNNIFLKSGLSSFPARPLYTPIPLATYDLESVSGDAPFLVSSWSNEAVFAHPIMRGQAMSGYAAAFSDGGMGGQLGINSYDQNLFMPYDLQAAVSAGVYFEFNLSAKTELLLLVESIQLGSRRASIHTGPNYMALKSIREGYSIDLVSDISTSDGGGLVSNSKVISIPTHLQDLNTQTSLRLYGYGRNSANDMAGIWVITNPYANATIDSDYGDINFGNEGSQQLTITGALIEVEEVPPLLSISSSIGGNVSIKGLIPADIAEPIFAIPEPGYVFSGWTGAVNSLSNPLVMDELNGHEIIATFSPDHADDDNDGLSNYEEIHIYKTDPLVADTSGDGIFDGEAVALGLNPLSNYSSLVNIIHTRPKYFGLYTEEDILDFRIGGLVISLMDNPDLSIQFKLEKSIDLKSWVTYEQFNTSISIPTEKLFMRVTAQPHQKNSD